MKIAFITTYDARDVRHWSGLGYFIARALSSNGLDVEFFGPIELDPMARILSRTKALWHNRLERRRYFRNHDAFIARRYARTIDRELATRPDIDLVFSPGTIPIAFIKDPRPLAFWSDTTHASIFEFYAEYSGLCRENTRDGHRIEQLALDRSAAALFSSDWAAQSASRDYGVPAARVHLVPFGANLSAPPTEAEVEQFVAGRPRDRCRLLFIGVDWKRKGGPLAVQIADELNRGGLPTELTIVGCQPYGREKPPPFVRLEGFLSKNDPAGNRRLRALLAEHHFLIVPSLAECYGLVYCEANAFAMPCLARRTGGVPTIVKHGENGWLFDVASGPAPYVAAIREVFADFNRYHTMARASRENFTTRLNWDVAGRTAAEILRNCPAVNPCLHV